MKSGKNRGSASVYMICLLIPTVICVCMLIRYAQLVSAKGMVIDAVGLAENAVMSAYNHPMKDAYGIFCYTKSEEEMKKLGETYMNKSLPQNIQGQINVQYSGATLADNTAFMNEIDSFMSKWSSVAYIETSAQTSKYCDMVTEASVIRDRIRANYNSAMTIGGISEIEIPEELSAIRENAVGCAEADTLTLAADNGSFNYSGQGNIIKAENRKIAASQSIDTNVYAGMCMLDDVENYYTPITAAYQSQLSQNQNYKLALYAYGNFDSFHNMGCISFTGRYYQSDEYKSVCPWGEGEFIINSSSDYNTNWNKVKYQIYESLFAEYLVGMYDSYISDPDINDYATQLAGENTEYIPMIKDELVIGVCANLAYSEMLKVYRYEGTCTMQSYMHYIQLFDMIEVERDKSGVLDRVRHVMTTNAHSWTSAEAQEFGFAKARTKVDVTMGRYNVVPSF